MYAHACRFGHYLVVALYLRAYTCVIMVPWAVSYGSDFDLEAASCRCTAVHGTKASGTCWRYAG